MRDVTCLLEFAAKGFFVTLFLLKLHSSPAHAWEGSVTRVLDGDSLEVQKTGQIYSIRLYGIDSPEYGQPCWREAKRLTRSLVLGETVTIDPMDADRYGRIVALVRKQGQLINSELVRNGLAWVYSRYCRAQPLCSDMKVLEQNARNQGLGLWREREPLPPWSWKQLQHENRSYR